MYKLKNTKIYSLAAFTLVMLASLLFAAPALAAVCPIDPDYSAAGTYDIPSGARDECERFASYIMVGDSKSPKIEYHKKSTAGADVVVATLILKNDKADPLIWEGPASYDKHIITIRINRSDFTDSTSGTPAKRIDKGQETDIQITTNQTLRDFAAVHNISVNPGAANFNADCKDTNVNKSNCGIIAYLVTFIRVLSGLVGVVVVGMIAIGGIQYSAARNNPQATAAAKGRITNAILALVFYLFIFAFLQWLVPGGVL